MPIRPENHAETRAATVAAAVAASGQLAIE